MKKTSKKEKLTAAQKCAINDFCENCKGCGFCAGGYTNTCPKLKKFATANKIPLIVV